MELTIDKIKQQFTPVLKSNDVEFAGIFGSYARGEANSKSDIDLLVRFNKPKSLLYLVNIERQLTAVSGSQVDLVTEHALSPYIRDQVLNDLQTIYGQR